MPRRLVRILALISLFVLIGPTPLGRVVRPQPVYDQVVRAVKLDWPASASVSASASTSTSTEADAGGVGRVGALTFVEGWELTSNYELFGGFSGIAMIGPRRFLLVGDTGLVTGFTLYPDGRVMRPFIAPLPDGPGSSNDKFARDAEALTATPDGSHYWIGFEFYHSIYRFGPSLVKAEAKSRPAAFKGLWKNGGIEALARLQDGRFLAIAEDPEKDGPNKGKAGVAAFLFQGDPTEVPDQLMRFRYDAEGKGAVTDVQQLPDGRLIVLHRDLSIFAGFISTVAIADLNGIGPGEVMKSKQIARIKAPAIADNFEGLAVTTEGPDWYVWMLSDDNLMGFQRNLLIKYKIDRGLIAAPGPGFAG